MVVKGESRFDPRVTHDFKADAVDEAQVFPACDEEGSDPQAMHVGSDEFYLQYRNHTFLKFSYGLEAEPTLHEGKRFDKNIVRRHDIIVGRHYVAPDPS